MKKILSKEDLREEKVRPGIHKIIKKIADKKNKKLTHKLEHKLEEKIKPGIHKMIEGKKKVTLAKGVKVKRGVEEKMRQKKGSSSTGKYKNVKPKDFAGAAGGASKFSFPIPDIRHARNALARAHFAPNPDGIRAKVYKKFPELKIRHEKRKGKK